MYSWRVIASALAVAVASQVNAEEAKPPTFFESLVNAGFSLRKTITGPVKPAEFGYYRENGDNFFKSEFALLYSRTVTQGRDWWFGAEMAVEGRLSSQETARNNNVLRINPAFIHQYTPSQDPLTVLRTRFGAVYESSQDFKIQNAYGEFELIPAYQPLAIGVDHHLLAGIYFRWEPIFGLQAGANLKREAPTFEQSDTILRLVPQLHARFSTPEWAQFFRLKESTLTFSLKEYYLALENSSKRNNSLFEASWELAFTPELSLTTSYKTGRAPPKFAQATEFGVMLGIKFGN